MSLSNIMSSTISTVINNFIIVINDGNLSHRSNQNIEGNEIHDNSRVTQSPVISLGREMEYVYVGHGVASDISKEKIVIVVCMLVIFSVFGCLGNGLVLYVFTKKNDKVTSTIFILALAWTDFFTCLVIIPFTAVDIGLDSRLYLDFLCKTFHFLITSNVPLSAFIMVAIAVDRYFSICQPFKRVVTPMRARISIVCLVLMACTLGSITTCMYGVWSPTNIILNATSDSTTPGISQAVYKAAPSQDETPTYKGMPRSDSSSFVSLTNQDAEITVSNTGDTVNLSQDTTQGAHPVSTESSRRIIEHSEGQCTTNELIFSEYFTFLYQKIYISFYIISLLAVFTLYFFIYRSVAKRREWRRKQKSFSHSPMTATTTVADLNNSQKPGHACCSGQEHLEMAPQNSSPEASNSNNKQNGGGNDTGELHSSAKSSQHKDAAATTTTTTTTAATATATKNCGHENGVESISTDKKTNRERRDFNFLANIRTAIMLFVVTLVFIISFLPAWLMATKLIDFEILIFYMHFIYNVANPVIYAFMNQSFRKELKRVFQRGRHLLRGG